MATDINFVVNLVVFRYANKNLQVLLSKSEENHPSFQGDSMHPHESAEDAAWRLLESSTGFSREDASLEQLQLFSAPGRVPEGREISVAYFGLIKSVESDKAHWSSVEFLKNMAHDHMDMLNAAKRALKTKLRRTTVAQYLLSEEFTLSDLEGLYEKVLGISLDGRNFRKRLLKLHLVTSVGKKRYGGSHRPAELYRFTEKGIQEENMI